MHRFLLFGMVAYFWLNISVIHQASSATPTPLDVGILFPLSDQVLQGSVPIQIILPTEGMISYELSFSYGNNPTDTWFLIHESQQPPKEGELILWDTSMLTDGDYTLRLVVWLIDGNKLVAEVPRLRVRNYSPVETNTPSPTNTTLPTAMTVQPSPTVTTTIITTTSSITPLPPNPAQIEPLEIQHSLLTGVLISIGLFTILGFYGLLRASRRR